MLSNILPGNLSYQLLIALPFPVEDQAVLSFVDLVPNLSPEEDSKVQAACRTAACRVRIQLGARGVVETKATALHELKYLVDPEMTGFGNFKGTMRDIAAIGDRADQRVEKRPASLVKWTIDEDAGVIARAGINKSFGARSAITCCHPRESGDPGLNWVPAFAGMTRGSSVTVNRRSCFVSDLSSNSTPRRLTSRVLPRALRAWHVGPLDVPELQVRRLER